MLHLFASSCFQLQVLVLGVVHLVIPRVPSDVMEHVQREREVEAFFIGQSGRGKICLLSVFTAQGKVCSTVIQFLSRAVTCCYFFCCLSNIQIDIPDPVISLYSM